MTKGVQMSATMIIRHTVADYGSWRKVYDEVEPLRVKHGYTAQRVMRLPDNPNDVAGTHDFPTVAQAEAFANDPELQAAMGRAGVTGTPRIEIFEDISNSVP
jgi:hypothetical protein